MRGDLVGHERHQPVGVCHSASQFGCREAVVLLVRHHVAVDAADLEIFEQAVADLNEGADIRIERELEALLADFLNQPENQP